MSIKKKLSEKKEEKHLADGMIRLSRSVKATSELRKTVKYLTKEVEDLTRDLSLAIGTSGLKPIKVPRKKRKTKNHLTPVVLWSDHHIEEVVPPEQTNFLNSYGPEESESRFNRLVEETERMIKRDSSLGNVSEAVIWLGGDFISGHIHDDLIEATAMAPLEAGHLVYQRLMGGLEYLSSALPLDRFYIPTSYGNHGRITSGKPRIATAASHNIEQAIYRSMARDLKDDDRFVFDCQPTRLKILDLHGFKIRFSHGDDIRYQGGTGGFHAPLVNQVRRWNQETQVDLDCLGHYHTFVDLRFALMNGSLIGHSEYSRKFGFEVPQQVYFVVDHSKNLRSGTYPIWVD
jgi:hypothetical protein